MAKEKEIFRDCYNLLKVNLEKPNWIMISEVADNLLHKKYLEDENDNFLCAELVAVVVNHLDRKRENKC